MLRESSDIEHYICQRLNGTSLAGSCLAFMRFWELPKFLNYTKCERFAYMNLTKVCFRTTHHYEKRLLLLTASHALPESVKDKGYLDCCDHSAFSRDDEGQGANVDGHKILMPPSTEIENNQPILLTELSYSQCPRDILFPNSGNPSLCGRMCEKAKTEDAENYIERDALQNLMVIKRALFNSVG